MQDCKRKENNNIILLEVRKRRNKNCAIFDDVTIMNVKTICESNLRSVR